VEARRIEGLLWGRQEKRVAALALSSGFVLPLLALFSLCCAGFTASEEEQSLSKSPV
jgi:hypothetical protein